MKIGFTGTRNGMTPAQQLKVGDILYAKAATSNTVEIHHGDCVGSDKDFHDICREIVLGCYIVGHPGYSAKNPDDMSNRAFCDVDEMREPKTHFARNRDIVNETDVLIATPPAMEELSSGGTWYTINISRGREKPRYIVFPDGTVSEK